VARSAGTGPAHAPCAGSSNPRAHRHQRYSRSTPSPRTTGPAGSGGREPHAAAQRYLVAETARCLQNSVRLSVIGRRDRLSADPCERSSTRSASPAPAPGCTCVSRSTTPPRGNRTRGRPRRRRRLLGAGLRAQACRGRELRRRRRGRPSDPYGWRAPIERLLTLECAYAELVFIDTYWPDFDEASFARLSASSRAASAASAACRPSRRRATRG